MNALKHESVGIVLLQLVIEESFLIRYKEFDGCERHFIAFPTNMRLWPDVGTMLGRRRRRRASIGPTSGQFLMFTGI